MFQRPAGAGREDDHAAAATDHVRVLLRAPHVQPREARAQQHEEDIDGLLGHQRHAEALRAAAKDLAGVQQRTAPRGMVFVHIHHRRQPARQAAAQVLLHMLAPRRVGSRRRGRRHGRRPGHRHRLRGRFRWAGGKKEGGFGWGRLGRRRLLGSEAFLLGGAHLPPEVVDHGRKEVADLLLLVDLEIRC